MIFRALNPGDQVRLRSGGPWMTVESTNGTTCVGVFFNETSWDQDTMMYDPQLYRITVAEVVLIHQDDVPDGSDDEQS